VWLSALAFSQLFLNPQLKTPTRVFLIALLLAVFYQTFIWGREWVGGWAPAAISILAILAINRSRLSNILILVVGVGLLAGSGILMSTLSSGDNPYSLSSRLEAWRVLGSLVQVNPVFGTGLANYYWYTRIFPIWGNYVSFNSHNNYMDILIQTGLLGLACFLWFFYESARLGWKLREIAPAGFERAYVYGALGGLIGTVIAAFLGDWVIPFVYNVGLAGFRFSMLGWLFLAGLVIIERNNTPADSSLSLLKGTIHENPILLNPDPVSFTDSRRLSPLGSRAQSE
jgi:O-antigen ligase